MTTTLTPIEFAHRPLEAPAPYRLWTRLVDHWQGRRDGRHLSAKQGQALDLDSATPDVLPSPWIVRACGAYAETSTREQITLARVVDPLLVALSQLPAPAVGSGAAEGPADHADAIALTGRAGGTQAAGQGSPGPAATTTGETFESPHEREARRQRQEADARAAAAAAARAKQEAAARDAKARAELESRITTAQQICAQRIAAAHGLLGRRLASYGRGLQRTAPSSALLESLLGQAFAPELPTIRGATPALAANRTPD